MIVNEDSVNNGRLYLPQMSTFMQRLCVKGDKNKKNNR